MSGLVGPQERTAPAERRKKGAAGMCEVAVDIGGTFTDVVCVKERLALFTVKVPTTTGNLVDGILEGTRRVLALAETRPEDVTRFIHSTTIATNAILERKGAITGVLMTEGFEDVLEIGRQKRSELYDLNIDAESPTFLAPRHLRAGICERMDSHGSVVEALDEAQVVSVVRRWRQRFGVESVAVCYLFSFVNPAHERRTKELLVEQIPEVTVSLSSELDPVFREYERACLTAFDAYVRPMVSRYIDALSQELRRMGIAGTLQVMQSSGGLTGFEIVNEKPVTMLLSGPASGVIGGRYTALQSGEHDLITVDIGGTSCDVALVRGGEPLVSRDARISVYPLRQTMIDVNTVGAGGGSIAWLDTSGGLHVGPQSAGSDPGPACYDRGGRRPTVTDASVVLGYLNPDYFADGSFKLNADAARAVIEKMGRELNLPPPALAAGIHRIINARMANEIGLVSVKRGYDPRAFSLVSLGGAGPVHGGRLAQQLGIPREIVPAAPGVLSAFGLLVANVEHELTRTLGGKDASLDPERIAAMLEELDTQITARMEREAGAASDVQVLHFADLRYVGQAYELEVPLPGNITEVGLRDALDGFHRSHRQVHGYDRPEAPVEVINLRSVHLREATALTPVTRHEGRATVREARKGTRSAYFDEYGEYRDTPVYDRSWLPAHEPVTGPAIIEQPDTTTVVYPGRLVIVDAAGNLVITAEATGRPCR